MAIVSMANAVTKTAASSAEYNKVVANVVDLDARLGPVVSTSTAAARLTSLESITANGTSGNAALNTRVATIENRGVARYERQSGTQTFVNGDQLISFPTAVSTSSQVTKSGNSYTLQPGTWLIDAALRVDFTGVATGSTDFALYLVTGTAASESTAFDGAWGKDPLANITTVLTITAATTVSLNVWRNAAGGTVTSYGAGLTHIAFAKLA